MDCEAQLTWKCALCFWVIFANRVSHTDLFLVCHRRSTAGICTQDYKSLCAAARLPIISSYADQLTVASHEFDKCKQRYTKYPSLHIYLQSPNKLNSVNVAWPRWTSEKHAEWEITAAGISHVEAHLELLRLIDSAILTRYFDYSFESRKCSK